VTELATERLRLRPLTQADAGFVLELLNDAGWLAHIGDRGVRSLETARDYIAERFTPDRWFAVCDAAGEPLGVCGLVARDGLDAPDIGYALLARHCGRGYATEAAAAVLRHARETLGFQRIVAITAPDNKASQRVLEKIGLRPAGTIHVPGQDGPSAYFTS
jgi:RimJ/RimL family protein N-acetyltransferase